MFIVLCFQQSTQNRKRSSFFGAKRTEAVYSDTECSITPYLSCLSISNCSRSCYICRKFFWIFPTYVSSAAKQMLSILVPRFSADAAHCKGPTVDTLFSMHGLFFNKCQVLILFMLVADNEIMKTCNIFLEFLYKSIDSSREDKILIIDQHKGGKNSLESLLSKVRPFFVHFISKKTFIKTLGLQQRKTYEEIIDCWTKEEHISALFKLSLKANEYFMSVSEAEQISFLRKVLCGKGLNQVTEVMNNANDDIGKKNLFFFYKHYRKISNATY